MMKYILSVLLIISSCYLGFSQVGINTTDPDASAALDIVAEDSGILIPRMTTLQKTEIEDPAHSLLVYDTDLEGYYFNQGTMTTPNWTPMLSGKAARDNYVLVKSVDDLPAAADGKITLDENTYYEINGTITLTASINLNNAYVSGMDASEDVLFYSGGTVFAGSTGGNIRNVTLSGAKAFNITGPGIASASSLLVQNTIIANMTTSVGDINGIGLVFGNIVQFIDNLDGITYSNIGNLLLNNQAWIGNNSGTYETFTGNFGLVEKASGFSTVSSSATGLDVSNNPTVGTGTLIGTVFSGSGLYVDPYNSGTGIYNGYNFSNTWTINSPGIKKEEDDVTTANIYYSSANIVTLSSGSIKLPVTTTLTRNFRSSQRSSGNSSNSFVYKGNEDKVINVFGSISFTAIAGMRLTFSVHKNGTLVPGSQVVYDVADTNGRLGLAIVATVDVKPNDYLEIYVERNISSGSETNDNQFLVTSYNLLFN